MATHHIGSVYLYHESPAWARQNGWICIHQSNNLARKIRIMKIKSRDMIHRLFELRVLIGQDVVDYIEYWGLHYKR